jgi:hypothetical protein
MANPYQPGPLHGGARSLMGALLQGDEIESAAKSAAELQSMKVAGEHADTDRKITQAYLERDKRVAQKSYQTDMEAAGLSPQAAKLLSSLAIGGHGSAIDNIQKYDMREDAVPALQAEGVSPANAILAAMAGRPLDQVKVQGGQIIEDPYAQAPSIRPTEAHAAQAQASMARAGASAASADASRARADATRDRMANPGKYRAPGGSGSRGGRGTERERAIEALRQAEADGYDVTGLDARDVLDSWKRTGDWKPRRKGEGGGEIRVIGARGTRDIPSGRPAAKAAPTAAKPPVAGARKAPDGKWYVQKQGKWFRVDG